jgi:hypothetical protein
MTSVDGLFADGVASAQYSVQGADPVARGPAYDRQMTSAAPHRRVPSSLMRWARQAR